MNTRFYGARGQRTEVTNETAHGGFNRYSIRLRGRGPLWPSTITTHKGVAQSAAPLRQKRMPVTPRIAKIANMCISFPNGNQIISASTEKI